jgi:hypothetical protein
MTDTLKVIAAVGRVSLVFPLYEPENGRIQDIFGFEKVSRSKFRLLDCCLECLECCFEIVLEMLANAVMCFEINVRGKLQNGSLSMVAEVCLGQVANNNPTATLGALAVRT